MSANSGSWEGTDWVCSHWQVVESFVLKTKKQAESPRRSHLWKD